MVENSSLPINKRWPGRWAVRATIYTPNGTSINIETDLPDRMGKSLLQMLSASFALPEKAPKAKKRRTPVVG